MPQLKQVEKLIGMKIPVVELAGGLTQQINDRELTIRPPRPPRGPAKPKTTDGSADKAGADRKANNNPRPGKPRTTSGSNMSGNSTNTGNGGAKPAAKQGQPKPQGQRTDNRRPNTESNHSGQRRTNKPNPGRATKGE
jgi:ATP-dependent RNA helicase RhlE